MMDSFRVHIPEPCPMSMADMEPVQNGFHCAQCEKTVVDFRSYSTDDIQTYFKDKKGERVCGIIHAKKEEDLPAITITGDRMYRGVSRLFFAALLLVFTHLFMGCGGITEPTQDPPEHLVGIMEMPDIIRQDSLVPIDTQALQPILPEVPEHKPVVCGPSYGSDSLELLPEPTLTTKGEIEPVDFAIAGGLAYQTMPEFPGGEDALAKYLMKNVHYPEYEKEHGFQGKVYVSFTVAEDGTVEDVKIARGVEGAPGFNEEVIRVIQNMPKWKPGKEGGRNVRVPYNLPIDFHLD